LLHLVGDLFEFEFFLEFTSQRLIVSELWFVSAPMLLTHRSLLVLLQFCIIFLLQYLK